MLELLKEAVPRGTRVAVLWQRYRDGTGVGQFHEVTLATQALGVELQSLEVRGADEFESAFAAATREGAGALLMLPSTLFNANESRLAALAIKSQLPAMFWRRGFAEVGGLMAYGPQESEVWRRVATYVDKLLKGATPADLPVEQAMKFALVLNLKTAQALGITIPPTLLILADEVIK